MKKTVITFGLISGAFSALMMVIVTIFRDRIGFDKGAIVGYTVIVLSSLVVFFGIRSYRDNVGGGKISFGRAFAVGILISLITSACYVVTWEIIFYNFMPDFCDKYAAYMVEKVKASGGTQQAIEAVRQQMNNMKAMLNNPFILAAFGFIEQFPIGLIITVISAAFLKKRKSDEPGGDEFATKPLQMIREP